MKKILLTAVVAVALVACCCKKADQGECAKEACCPKTECVEKCCQKADSCCQKPDSCKAECPKADSCSVMAECPAQVAE